MIDPPRNTALTILNNIDRGHRTLDAEMDRVLDKSSLAARDRALAYTLVYGVMRWRARLDWIINHFSRTPMSHIEPETRQILRLAVFQIVHLDRIPDSAAVNTAVEMTKAAGKPWVVKFANGLLRNIAKNHEKVPFPDLEKDPLAAISANRSLPKWLARRWIDRFGAAEADQLGEVINTPPPMTVRINSLKIPRKSLLRLLEKEAERTEPTLYSPEGLSLFHPKGPVPKMEGFSRGYFQVQDEGAQLITRLLAPQKGETVMDACAGMGGKTGHIAQLMENSGRIVALDQNEMRLGKLQHEMARLGGFNVNIVPHDLNTPPTEKGLDRFDRILVDAPCSGLGVLRRNPDGKWYPLKRDFDRYHQRQVRFLTNLASLVKPGGRMVYAVCSMEPEENETVVEDFLKDNPRFVLDPSPGVLPGDSRKLIGDDGCFRTFPHRHGMDGFFAAAFKKKGERRYL